MGLKRPAAPAEKDYTREDHEIAIIEKQMIETQQKVEQLVAHLARFAPTQSTGRQARIYERIHSFSKITEKHLAEVNKVKDVYSRQTLPEAFDADGITSMRIAGLGLFVITPQVTASTLDRDKANAWLRENGYGDAVVEMCPPQRFSSICAEMDKEGKAPPPDAAKINKIRKTSIRE